MRNYKKLLRNYDLGEPNLIFLQLGIASLRDRSYKTSSEVLFSWDNIKVFRSWTMLPTPYGSRPLCKTGLIKCGRKSKSDFE